MEFSCSTTVIDELDTDALVIGVFEDEVSDPVFSLVDRLVNGFVSICRTEGEIKGTLGEMTIIHAINPHGPRRFLILGLGDSAELTLKKVRQVSAESARKLRNIHCSRITFSLLGYPVLDNPEEIAWTISEGVLLGHYQFRKYFSRSEEKAIKSVTLSVTSSEMVPLVEKGIRYGVISGEETNFSKDICNEPSNVVTPTKMAEITREIAQNYELGFGCLDRDAISAQGMGLLEAVSRGSIEPPCLIWLEYKGDPDSTKTIGLVGKGVTFDSGGVSLKSERGMYTMKRDLTGGAVVIALMKSLARLAVPLNVVAVVPCAENMPGGKAYKPGDIIASYSGKKVEIFNTDAEGRLLLADALTFIQKMFQPYLVIDVATLTGGAIHAVGPRIIPFFSTSRYYANVLVKAGEDSGETVWEFPLFEEYQERVFSHFADVKNNSDKPPQTIVGALFLREFIDRHIEWMHLDIAALDTSSAEYSYISRGATGVAVRPLLRFLLSLSQKVTSV